MNGQDNVHCLEKPLGINIPQKKERDEHSIFYKNVYGADIKPRLTDIDENAAVQWQDQVSPKIIKIEFLA